MIILGLDIGSNSVGSAWVDTENQDIAAGVSVFPAGVDETEDKRGAPKNQDRRSKRSLRRTLTRRSKRKRQVRQVLMAFDLLPHDRDALQKVFSLDPWVLRRRGLYEPLTAHEFGRVLVHLGQRRGAIGINAEADDKGDVKQAMTRVQLAILYRYGSESARSRAQSLQDQIEKLSKKEKRTDEERNQLDDAREGLKAHCHSLMQDGAVTFGRFIADVKDERRHELIDPNGQPKTSKQGNRSHYDDPVRNRLDSFEFHADRPMIRAEFEKLWKRQSESDGAISQLGKKKREELKLKLDNPQRDTTWRHKGYLFGQRDTYWDTGTLGRCDLEPTDRCAPIADRHASYYRVIESVNNIRIKGPGDREERPLTTEERSKVIERLRTQKSGTIASVRAALGIDKRSLKKQDIPENSWSLNLEKDKDREINTDWFHREIILSAIGEETWDQWPDAKKEGLNRALLKCDPTIDDDADRLRGIAKRLGLDDATSDRLVEGWKTRPKLERRLQLSRKAVENLLSFMCDAFVLADRDQGKRIKWWWLKDRDFDPQQHRWPTQIEARQMFADNGASDQQRQRYRIGAQTLTKADRHYMNKHPNELPPAPTLSNPVVRKAIHEVRRHVIAHIRANGKKPDRISIEFARETTKPKKISDWILALNRKREQIRKKIIEEVIGDAASTLSNNQLKAAVDRVILARQQRHQCAYCGNDFGSITDPIAAMGQGRGGRLEIDHIIPRAVGGRDAWNNRVLCWEKSNRDKGKKLPRKWWGNRFDELARPMSFMDGYEPSKGDPNEYFTKSDYAAKWKNFSREDVPKEWRGSQLTDTAYAARQVQSYLQSALWPDEKSHLEGGQRRIFVTKGAYTHQLRKDWQLFQKLIDPSHESQQEVQEASAKNRGDHREHAVDAVAVALIAEPGSISKGSNDKPSTRIDDLAHHQQQVEEERLQAKMKGRDPRGLKRKPLPPPWGSDGEFRRQVMSMIYGEYEELPGESRADHRDASQPIVVSHRPVGRRITSFLHKDTLFGLVSDKENIYTGRKAVTDLKPAHLRMPIPEKKKDSINRLTQEYLNSGVEKTKSKARKRAKEVVESPDFIPPSVDPPPQKDGLVRDIDLRRRLRECIESFEYTETDRDGNIKVRRTLNPDDFSQREIKQAFEIGAICHKSGVPIKRVKLLRTHKDPVIINRKKWDHVARRWVRDTGKDGDLPSEARSRADRVYESRNNHHIEIREDEKGKWNGVIVSMFEAAKRVRIEKRDAVDRSDDPEKGGRFIMSLSEGETVYMKPSSADKADNFVVFKLDKPRTIQFKHHWDARRAKGEKDDDGNVRPDSKRDEIPVSAAQLRDLAPAGHNHPVKVNVSALGEVTPLELD